MISQDVVLKDGVVIHHPDLVNLYGCTVGRETRIGTFVEVQKKCDHRCSVQDLESHLYL